MAAPRALASAAAVLQGCRLQRLLSTGYPTGRRRYLDAEIADHFGVSGQYISNRRKGRSVPALEKAVRLASFQFLEQDAAIMRRAAPRAESPRLRRWGCPVHRAGRRREPPP
ncbi:hypothetical protein ACFQ2B_39410 [Streptomyces stramineus]